MSDIIASSSSTGEYLYPPPPFSSSYTPYSSSFDILLLCLTIPLFLGFLFEIIITRLTAQSIPLLKRHYHWAGLLSMCVMLVRTPDSVGKERDWSDSESESMNTGDNASAMSYVFTTSTTAASAISLYSSSSSSTHLYSPSLLILLRRFHLYFYDYALCLWIFYNFAALHRHMRRAIPPFLRKLLILSAGAIMLVLIVIDLVCVTDTSSSESTLYLISNIIVLLSLVFFASCQIICYLRLRSSINQYIRERKRTLQAQVDELLKEKAEQAMIMNQQRERKGSLTEHQNRRATFALGSGAQTLLLMHQQQKEQQQMMQQQQLQLFSQQQQQQQQQLLSHSQQQLHSPLSPNNNNPLRSSGIILREELFLSTTHAPPSLLSPTAIEQKKQQILQRRREQQNVAMGMEMSNASSGGGGGSDSPPLISPPRVPHSQFLFDTPVKSSARLPPTTSFSGSISTTSTPVTQTKMMRHQSTRSNGGETILTSRRTNSNFNGENLLPMMPSIDASLLTEHQQQQQQQQQHHPLSPSTPTSHPFSTRAAKRTPLRIQHAPIASSPTSTQQPVLSSPTSSPTVGDTTSMMLISTSASASATSNMSNTSIALVTASNVTNAARRSWERMLENVHGNAVTRGVVLVAVQQEKFGVGGESKTSLTIAPPQSDATSQISNQPELQPQQQHSPQPSPTSHDVDLTNAFPTATPATLQPASSGSGNVVDSNNASSRKSSDNPNRLSNAPGMISTPSSSPPLHPLTTAQDFARFGFPTMNDFPSISLSPLEVDSASPPVTGSPIPISVSPPSGSPISSFPGDGGEGMIELRQFPMIPAAAAPDASVETFIPGSSPISKSNDGVNLAATCPFPLPAISTYNPSSSSTAAFQPPPFGGVSSFAISSSLLSNNPSAGGAAGGGHASSHSPTLLQMTPGQSRFRVPYIRPRANSSAGIVSTSSPMNSPSQMYRSRFEEVEEEGAGGGGAGSHSQFASPPQRRGRLLGLGGGGRGGGTPNGDALHLNSPLLSASSLTASLHTRDKSFATTVTGFGIAREVHEQQQQQQLQQQQEQQFHSPKLLPRTSLLVASTGGGIRRKPTIDLGLIAATSNPGLPLPLLRQNSSSSGESMLSQANVSVAGGATTSPLALVTNLFGRVGGVATSAAQSTQTLGHHLPPLNSNRPIDARQAETAYLESRMLKIARFFIATFVLQICAILGLVISLASPSFLSHISSSLHWSQIYDIFILLLTCILFWYSWILTPTTLRSCSRNNWSWNLCASIGGNKNAGQGGGRRGVHDLAQNQALQAPTSPHGGGMQTGGIGGRRGSLVFEFGVGSVAQQQNARRSMSFHNPRGGNQMNPPMMTMIQAQQQQQQQQQQRIGLDASSFATDSYEHDRDPPTTAIPSSHNNNSRVHTIQMQPGTGGNTPSSMNVTFAQQLQGSPQLTQHSSLQQHQQLLQQQQQQQQRPISPWTGVTGSPLAFVAESPSGDSANGSSSGSPVTTGIMQYPPVLPKDEQWILKKFEETTNSSAASAAVPAALKISNDDNEDTPQLPDHDYVMREITPKASDGGGTTPFPSDSPLPISSVTYENDNGSGPESPAESDARGCDDEKEQVEEAAGEKQEYTKTLTSIPAPPSLRSKRKMNLTVQLGSGLLPMTTSTQNSSSNHEADSFHSSPTVTTGGADALTSSLLSAQHDTSSAPSPLSPQTSELVPPAPLTAHFQPQYESGGSKRLSSSHQIKKPSSRSPFFQSAQNSSNAGATQTDDIMRSPQERKKGDESSENSSPLNPATPIFSSNNNTILPLSSPLLFPSNSLPSTPNPSSSFTRKPTAAIQLAPIVTQRVRTPPMTMASPNSMKRSIR